MKYEYDWRDLKDYASYAQTPGEEPGYPLPIYAINEIKPDVLVGITNVFFPQFVLHEEGVFLSDHFDIKRYASWKRTFGDDSRKIERSINHVYLVDMYYGLFTRLNKQNRAYLGEILTQTWRLHCNINSQSENLRLVENQKITMACRILEFGFIKLDREETWLFCTMNLQNSLGFLLDGLLDALCKVTYTFPRVIHIRNRAMPMLQRARKARREPLTNEVRPGVARCL
jgi:hypothetical protein